MCTLTYIPKPDNGFIVTSNRDETPLKPALHPSRKYIHPKWITYPTDITGGGSWIAATDDGTIAVLLNGAFTAHKRTPPYGHTRGKIVLVSFRFVSLQELSEKYILDNIEPFTLVHIKPGKVIEELRWDGNTAHCNTFAADTPHIWSSASLYNKAMQEERNGWFTAFLNKIHDPKPEDIWDFHLNGGKDAPIEYRICMQRKHVETLSIFQIHRSKGKQQYRYVNIYEQRHEQS